MRYRVTRPREPAGGLAARAGPRCSLCSFVHYFDVGRLFLACGGHIDGPSQPLALAVPCNAAPALGLLYFCHPRPVSAYPAEGVRRGPVGHRNPEILLSGQAEDRIWWERGVSRSTVLRRSRTMFEFSGHRMDVNGRLSRRCLLRAGVLGLTG